MMSSILPELVLLVFSLIVLMFFIFRLRLFSEEIPGRYIYLFGSVLVLAGLFWKVLTALPDYSEWFVATAYFWLDLALYVVFGLGLLMLVISFSLYTDYWQTRKEELEEREQKQSILSNLQRDSRHPYQLLELLELSIKEITSSFPGLCGAIFLANRTKRQFVLAASAGLSRKEISGLEFYPLEQNIVNQAMIRGESMLTSDFPFYNEKQVRVSSRFKSTLVIPMISGSDRFGGIILFAQQQNYFSRLEIDCLSPVADWLAEKIKNTRLVRQLGQMENKLKARQEDLSNLSSRILGAAGALSSSDVVTSFCRSLVGLCGSQSVHLFGLQNGSLRFHGGSEPLLGLSESYKTALVNAFDRKKPLIVNQEAVNDQGQSYIAQSTFIFPLPGYKGQEALLFRTDTKTFQPTEDELKQTEMLGHLAGLVLMHDSNYNQAITRRKGFNKVLELLRFDPDEKLDDSSTYLVDHLGEILPGSAMTIGFTKEADGSFSACHGFKMSREQLSSLSILPGEGLIGQSVSHPEPIFSFGKNTISKLIDSYEDVNRDVFRTLFGDRGMPVFMATCPVLRMGSVIGVLLILIYELDEKQRGEWERLITLAVGLFSVRLNMTSMYIELKTPREGRPSGMEPSLTLVNRLNNHLSAVIGNAELAVNRTDLNGEARKHIKSIIVEAEQAAEYLEKEFRETLRGDKSSKKSKREGLVTDIINDILTRVHISDDLHMLGGRPREVFKRFDPVGPVAIKNNDIDNLFEEVLNRFASESSDEDVITLAIYRRGGYVFIDISRHRHDFPPVSQVGEFGIYQKIDQAIEKRPTDAFLRHLTGQDCDYSVDRHSASPAYLSFKFPLAATAEADIVKKNRSNQDIGH